MKWLFPVEIDFDEPLANAEEARQACEIIEKMVDEFWLEAAQAIADETGRKIIDHMPSRVRALPPKERS